MKHGVRGQPAAAAEHLCQTDDKAGQLYVNEENVGFWRYPADAEAPLQREPVDLVKPFGALTKVAAGMALVPGGLLALDAEAPALHLYRQSESGWQADGVLPLDGLDEPERISARRTSEGVELLLADEQGLHRAQLAWQPQALPHPEPIVSLAAAVETGPVPSLGTPPMTRRSGSIRAILRRAACSAPTRRGGLVVYDTEGRQLQSLTVGRLNNVDVRSGLRLGSKRVDGRGQQPRPQQPAPVRHRPRSGCSDIGQIATPLSDIYGLCMFQNRQGVTYAIANGTAPSSSTASMARSGQPHGEWCGALSWTASRGLRRR